MWSLLTHHVGVGDNLTDKTLQVVVQDLGFLIWGDLMAPVDRRIRGGLGLFWITVHNCLLVSGQELLLDGRSVHVSRAVYNRIVRNFARGEIAVSGSNLEVWLVKVATHAPTNSRHLCLRVSLFSALLVQTRYDFVEARKLHRELLVGLVFVV